MQTLEVARKCCICHQTYALIDSVGRLECREHASMFLERNPESGPGRALYRWPCCGVETDYSTPALFYSNKLEKSIRGCIRADHKHTLDPYCKRAPSDFTLTRYTEGANSILLPARIVEKFAQIDSRAKQTVSAKDIEIFMFDREGIKSKTHASA